jgi:RNA-directed DNA polymerase
MPNSSDRRPFDGITTLEDLSRLLGVEQGSLTAVATDVRKHYYIWDKSDKGKTRRFHSPDNELKNIQTRLTEVLSHVPLPEWVHGWRKGHSVLRNAKKHVGKDVVCKFDLADFFPSCRFERVRRLFLSLGCGDEMAAVLTRLTTASYHLPLGFVTSPVLANLLLARLDARMHGAAEKFNACLGRYGDDIALSGKISVLGSLPTMKRIVHESGFKLNLRKFQTSGVRFWWERQEVCSVVVNKTTNPPRTQYDQVWRELSECGRSGPTVAQRVGETTLDTRRRLKAKISYIRSLNPRAAAKLERRYRRIDWDHRQADQSAQVVSSSEGQTDS